MTVLTFISILIVYSKKVILKVSLSKVRLRSHCTVVTVLGTKINLNIAFLPNCSLSCLPRLQQFTKTLIVTEDDTK